MPARKTEGCVVEAKWAPALRAHGPRAVIIPLLNSLHGIPVLVKSDANPLPSRLKMADAPNRRSESARTESA